MCFPIKMVQCAPFFVFKCDHVSFIALAIIFSFFYPSYFFRLNRKKLIISWSGFIHLVKRLALVGAFFKMHHLLNFFYFIFVQQGDSVKGDHNPTILYFCNMHS